VKLLIQTPLIKTEVFPLAVDYYDVTEYLTSIKNKLHEYCVYATIEINEEAYIFTCLEQKVYLDDIDMNTIFDILYYMFNGLFIRYVPLGGEGCELSLAMRQS
jgi:hypothetical protein